MALLLTILKTIGMILLVILAVLLILLLLVLFCPAVYRIKGKKQENFFLHIRLSWLFPLIYGNIKYDEKLSCILYVLGIPVYDMLNGKTTKQEKRKKKKNSKGKAEESPRYKIGENEESPRYKIGENEDNLADVIEPSIEQHKTQEESEQKPSFFQKANKRIKEFLQKIKLFFQKLFEKVMNIKYTVLSIKEKLENFKETVEWYKEILSREESKRAIGKGKKQLIKLMSHMCPKKVKGNILFGFLDPGTTGEVLGLISMFYPVLGNHITIIPDFEREIFLGDIYIKGRIRAFNLLRIGWSVLFDKDIKNLYNILTGGKNHE